MKYKHILAFTESEYLANSWAEDPESTAQPPTFNWWVLFFGSLWFVYRKMYLFAFLMWVLSIIVSTVTVVLVAYNSDSTAIDNAIYSSYAAMFLLVRLPAAIFAYSIYKKWVERKIEKIKGLELADEDLESALAKKGGTSEIILFIVVIAQIISNVAMRFL